MESEIRIQVETLRQLLDEARNESLSLGERAGIFATASILVDRIFQRLEDNDIKARNQVLTKGRNLVSDIAVLVGFENPRNSRDQHYIWGIGNHDAVVFYLKQGEVFS